MEVFNPTTGDLRAYRRVMLQHGSGFDKDGYYYYSQQEGEGVASFFGNLLKSVYPVIKQGIKGSLSLAKPHLKKAAGDIVASGSKRLLENISGNIVNKIEKPKRKRRRRRL